MVYQSEEIPINSIVILKIFLSMLFTKLKLASLVSPVSIDGKIVFVILSSPSVIPSSSGGPAETVIILDQL